MRKWLCLSLGIVLSTALTVSASEFRLEPKELSITDARAYSGQRCGLTLTKPSFCRNESPAKSRRPLYGYIGTGSHVGMFRAEWPAVPDPHMRIFRLDETKGDGRGYDQLILDLNGNNDLTDDPAARASEDPASPPNWSSSFETAVFGPIAAGPGQTVGLWHPAYYAETQLYWENPPKNNGEPFTGWLVIRPANYLQVTVEIDSIKQMMGIIDANCNGQLGDRPRQVKLPSPDTSRFLLEGDRLLRDLNGSGRFEITAYGDESEWFGSQVFWGRHPYTITLARNLESMRIEPYSGPTGELVIQPLPAHVRRITLFRDSGGTEVEPVTVSGPAKLPVGVYESCDCLVEVTSGTNQTIRGTGLWLNHPTALKVEANTATVLKCGPPFMITPLASIQQIEAIRPGLMGAAAGLFGGRNPTAGSVKINLGEISGAGSEIYPMLLRGNSGRLPPPRFSITDNAGKKVASGQLEYG